MNVTDYALTKTRALGYEPATDHVAFMRATEQLQTLTGDWSGSSWRVSKSWQLAFWKEWFAVVRDIGPTEAIRLCTQQINKLRGR